MIRKNAGFGRVPAGYNSILPVWLAILWVVDTVVDTFSGGSVLVVSVAD